MKLFSNIIMAMVVSIVFVSNGMAAKEYSNEAVVKVFVAKNSPDFYRPWQSQGISGSSGSGVIIGRKYILTNAHVVSDYTFIQLKKYSDPKKYTAKVEYIGHDCDLALLSVDDPDFYNGVPNIELGELPELQDNVTVIGYPQGGDKLSITKGVVSRIEVNTYSISARQLLTTQIDAAINPGNSGGPVMLNGKLVGIAMQTLSQSQNIGYMIPPPIIRHFLEDYEDGTYDGFPILGVEFGNTENQALRRYTQIEDKKGGVMVTSLLPFSPAEGYLKEGDVILKINDVPIGEDGTFSFRESERLELPYLITDHQVNEVVSMDVVREGEMTKVQIPLIPFQTLVPYPYQFEKPQYYIYGGMVFTVLSADLLKSWGQKWWEKAPRNMLFYLIDHGRLNRERKKDLVVLLHVLNDNINAGYHDLSNVIIQSVNGEEFETFEEFVKKVEKAKIEPYTILESDVKQKIIMDNTDIETIDAEIMRRNSIPAAMSEDVKTWL